MLEVVCYKWSEIHAIRGITSWSHMARYRGNPQTELLPGEPRLSNYGIAVHNAQDDIVMLPTWVKLT